MPVTTTSAAVHITPVVLKTFYKHTKHKGHKVKNGDTTEEATDDLIYDEAFHIVKAFIQLGTRNKVESLQHFTNTHVPAPYWAAVPPVRIPMSSCNKAADLIIKWFDPEDLKQIVGGERWWQIRGLDGIDAEWVTEKEYLDDTKPPPGNELSDDDCDILRMDHLETVMLYVHGGAYFWGSINTHRYQIIRYARKFKGRAFAVNYRKAPQYPWPCPLQDVIAAYLYLTSPPPEALHKPVPSSKIVFAGDSAGAGLCLTMLTVLRDLGLEQPAGAVLISPWVDLTHSFPSVMHNASTDIIPPHGFIHKPSTLWPIEAVPQEGRARVIPTQTNPPPKPGHADVLRPSDERLGEQVEQRMQASQGEALIAHAGELTEKDVKTQAEMHNETNGGTIRPERPPQKQSTSESECLAFWEPKPPKVLMNDPNDRPLELRSQIQLYATNEQLTHPLVSPILQGSLGNLCPLYIIAGDGECLRDEIIYVAHKAANPKEYPTREGTLKDSPRQRENVAKFQTPTKVHLQVFDGMCHVLTVFIFTDSAKYAYRSIAEFIKHVTRYSPEHLEQNPFPELHRPPSEISDPPSPDEEDHPSLEVPSGKKSPPKDAGKRRFRPDHDNGTRSDVELYRENESKTKLEVKSGDVRFVPDGSPATEDEDRDIPGVRMIRERVDIFGHVRLMEGEEEIPALQIPPSEIGLIKEDPVRRWLSGQEKWDKKYKRNAIKAERRRRHYEKKAAVLIAHARENGLILDNERTAVINQRASLPTAMSSTSVGNVECDRRWGPFDLESEQPPGSAIAGRRDTREAVALIKKHIYHSAPATHRTVPRMSTSDAARAAFDPSDHPFKPPRQSVSEEQVHSSKKAQQGKRQALQTLRTGSDKLKNAGSSHSQPKGSSQSSSTR
ncbi:unnamed protein product [Somion occarium]|uniref:Alpha/beta hydrolase fold-3 domain-containing protein n=1 Tax=Somion occarium TaxID=3059160 RepID=A0ABP1D337_9APHY